jgi:hypothetical protein
MSNRIIRIILVCALATGLGACATQPKPVAAIPDKYALQNLRLETDDLAMIADTTLMLASRFGPEQVLVVFDIDNTLLAMEQGLGSDPWYYWQKGLGESDPCSPQYVGDRFRAQGALFYASAMRPTQPDAAQQVRRIQDAGIRTIAITSRGTEYRLATFRELRRNGISFWPSALPPQRGFPDSYIPAGSEFPVRYEDGVFMTAGQHKGEMLTLLLQRTATPAPAVVVIADDKAKYLQQMMETFAGTGTAVHAWRYSHEDANVAALDKAQAAEMWDAALPALLTLQEVFGPDNFDLGELPAREGCRTED